MELGYNVLNPDDGYYHAELMLSGKVFLAVSEIGENFCDDVNPKYPNLNFGIVLDNEDYVRAAYSV